MRRFNYLIGRLHRAGFTWLVGLLMVLSLLPFLGASLQPMGSPADSLRDPVSPLNGFRFQWYGAPELAIGYQRQDHIRELSAYLSYLRHEKSLYNANEPDGDRRRYAAFLAQQESIHLVRLRETLGLIDQAAYYYGMYAPHWIQIFADPAYAYLPELNGADPQDRAQWNAFARTLQASDEPFLAAQGSNLLKQLPLTPHQSASSRLLYLIQISRFLLALLPLTVFFILFGSKDRNLRTDITTFDLTKGATVYLTSAAALILMRLFWYGLLYLRFGDRAGAMFIVPSWLAAGETGAVMTLRSFIQWISAADLTYLLFYSSFLCLIHALLRRIDLTILAGSASLMLPRSLFPMEWAGAFDPLPHFSFLHWSLRPELFDHFPGVALMWDLPNVLYEQAPQRQIPSLLVWAFLFLAMAWLVGQLRLKVIRRQTHQDHPGSTASL